jgi:hypothetical protein
MTAAEERIVRLWRTLADKAISSVLLDLGVRPHISLAGFEDLDPEVLRSQLYDFT